MNNFFVVARNIFLKKKILSAEMPHPALGNARVQVSGAPGYCQLKIGPREFFWPARTHRNNFIQTFLG